MTKLYITYDSSQEGGEPESDDEWCTFSDEHRTFSLENCYLSFDEKSRSRFEYFAHEVPFNVEKGDDIYLLVVRYSSGSTFGNIYGCHHIVDIYSSKEEAYKVEETIRNGTYSGYKCWEGYFESLEDVSVESLVVKQ